MSKNLKIQDALANEEPYIHLLASMSDERLERKLRIVHSQMDIALKNKEEEALELLTLWEKQIIEARMMKDDREIEPYADEIEREAAVIDAFSELSREPANKGSGFAQPEPVMKEEQEKPVRSNAPQLSLF